VIYVRFQSLQTITTASPSVFFPLPDYIITRDQLLLFGHTATVRHKVQSHYDVRQF